MSDTEPVADLFRNFDHLGFMMPFYVDSGEEIIVRADFESILSTLQEPPVIDPTAAIEIISRYRCFGDRTLVRGIQRTPWMAEPDSKGNGWQRATIPPHGHRVLPSDRVAAELFHLLRNEITEACADRPSIGILLSGGMDSRVAAGVLDSLLKDGSLQARVLAITWGLDQSRDVQYGERIARRLGWDWLHFPLTPDDLVTNIDFAARRGCEYSPVHLHAMPRVRELSGVDIILGASFGDSVGRAEYAGRHVTELRPMEQFVMNWFSLLKREAFQAAESDVGYDVDAYRSLYPRQEIYQEREIEQQIHYWRRQLNPCMSVINERIPLYQVFSAPETFGFMWSLSPQSRNDQVYLRIFDHFATKLLDIPWARTGELFLASSGQGDSLAKQHHQYGLWIRNELHDTIRGKVLTPGIDRLGIFNMVALERCLQLNRLTGHGVRALKLDEVLIWLAALSDFVKTYNISGITVGDTMADRLGGSLWTPMQILGHSGLNRVRGLS